MLKDISLKEGTARTVFVDYYLARHKARRDGWAKAGRLDLIIESQVVCARGDDGLAAQFAAEWHDVLTNLIGKRAAGAVLAKVKDDKGRMANVTDRLETINSNLLGDTLGKLLKDGKYRQIAAAPVVSFSRYEPGNTPVGVIDFKDVFGGTACFADRVEFVSSYNVSSLFVVADDVWIDRTAKSVGTQDYWLSLVVANGNVDCGKLQSSVVIADGDVRLYSTLNGPFAVFARGDISADDRLECPSSLLVAGGKITAKKLVAPKHAVGMEVGILLAKGGLELADEKEARKADPNREKGFILDGMGPADLGVRWFELADVGLEVAADGKVAVVKEVAVKSPFHKHLQPKDVLKEINGVPVVTPNAARRVLRRAYILGFAVVTFERDGKTVSKTVPIDDLMDTDNKK